MARKTGLGRGLDSLIPSGEFTPSGESSESAGEVLQIPTDRIAPNPRQPRTQFDPAELSRLADSIRAVGIIQPLIVTPSGIPGQYTLISGERRLLAARQAGLEQVPAIVRPADEQQLVELALVENIQREDLNPLEAAEAYRQLAEDFGLSHEAIAAQVGKSRTTVTNTLRLLKLPSTVRQALSNDQISEGHARALLVLLSPQAQSAALHTILKHALNVRQTEELVRKLGGERPPSNPRSASPPEIVDLENRLRGRLGTRVSLKPGRKGGTLVIHYYSQEELDTLVGLILGEE